MRDTGRLMKIRVKEPSFYLVYMLSLLPTDVFYFLVKEFTFWPLIRFNRLLRFNRVLELRSQTETSTNYPFFFRILSIFVAVIVVMHWNACFFFLVHKNLGYFNVVVKRPPNSSQFVELVAQYSVCFLRATLQLTTISNLESPRNSFERAFMVFNYLLGVLAFALIVGNVTEIIDDLNMKRSKFQERIDAVKSYMELRNVSKQLQERVIKWFENSWTNNGGLDEQLIFQEFLPENLQAEIAINIHLETLRRVHIFQDCEPGLLQQLVTRLKLQVFSPSDYVCRKGDIGREMYFIKSGRLSVVSEDGKKVFANLTEGSYFGEISILDIPGNKTGNRRTANVKSVGYSNLFCLTKADLWHALAEYPVAKKTLIEKGMSLLRKDNILNEDIINELNALEEINANVHQELNSLKDEIQGLDERTEIEIPILKSKFTQLNQRIDYLKNKINIL